MYDEDLSEEENSATLWQNGEEIFLSFATSSVILV